MATLGSSPSSLCVDGEELVGQFDDARISLPRLTYAEENGHGVLRFLGPVGFQITLLNPSRRICQFVDGGVRIRELVVTAGGFSLTVPVQFHKEWACPEGRKVFACLALDRSSDLQWLPASLAGTDSNDGKD